jgi:hypothetical protein
METETAMIAEGIEYVRKASPFIVAPTPEIRRVLPARPKGASRS